ncbi:unnamed protein product [Linum trigynum]|uniref:Uncharacterized protein n=1 Tax=Linum trigynum TaxID=586398 RepID=A0AAV2FQW5_9ROSI
MGYHSFLSDKRKDGRSFRGRWAQSTMKPWQVDDRLETQQGDREKKAPTRPSFSRNGDRCSAVSTNALSPPSPKPSTNLYEAPNSYPTPRPSNPSAAPEHGL